MFPAIPHLAPATLHPNSIAQPISFPALSANIVAALNVSPAPSVSTRTFGGKIGDVTRSHDVVFAAAPSSPQAHMTAPLKYKKILHGRDYLFERFFREK